MSTIVTYREGVAMTPWIDLPPPHHRCPACGRHFEVRVRCEMCGTFDTAVAGGIDESGYARLVCNVSWCRARDSKAITMYMTDRPDCRTCLPTKRLRVGPRWLWFLRPRCYVPGEHVHQSCKCGWWQIVSFREWRR